MKYTNDNGYDDKSSQNKVKKGNSVNYVHGLHSLDDVTYKSDKKVDVIEHTQYSLIVIYMHYEQDIEDNHRDGDIRGQKPLKRGYECNHGYQDPAQDQKDF